MAVNLQENSLYFRMFQVLVTPCLKIKVNLSPKTTSQTQYHLLDTIHVAQGPWVHRDFFSY